MHTMTPVRLDIKTLREKLGWSQSELSRQSGVRQATISTIEAGTAKSVSFDVLTRLARALKVDAAHLVDDDHEDE
jgi:transcriptional regulator with XRE-family HTH domain